jgi:hypothetical protein
VWTDAFDAVTIFQGKLWRQRCKSNVRKKIPKIRRFFSFFNRGILILCFDNDGMLLMSQNALVTAAYDVCRFQESLIPSFNEIAQTFLAGVPGDANELQKYLDGTVHVDGIRYRRRTVLLAIHDMKHEREAPPALQNETFVKLTLMKVRPIPPLKFYRDVATALLRLEVVMKMGTLTSDGSIRPQAGRQGHEPGAGSWPSA